MTIEEKKAYLNSYLANLRKLQGMQEEYNQLFIARTSISVSMDGTPRAKNHSGLEVYAAKRDALARAIALRVKEAGGRAMFVGGVVRDGLMGVPCKDIDLEVYGLAPAALRALLSQVGEVVEKGASFGVYGLAHSNLDVAMPRRERRTGRRLSGRVGGVA